LHPVQVLNNNKKCSQENSLCELTEGIVVFLCHKKANTYLAKMLDEEFVLDVRFFSNQLNEDNLGLKRRDKGQT
jgi:hypothetical protein